jgi:glycerol kinase
MKGRHILAIDQGTTSSRAMIFDDKGHCIALAHMTRRKSGSRCSKSVARPCNKPEKKE